MAVEEGEDMVMVEMLVWMVDMVQAEDVMETEEKEFVLYNIIQKYKGRISMIHPHNLINMNIAPPPEWTIYSGSLNQFEEGVIKHSPSRKESAFYV